MQLNLYEPSDLSMYLSECFIKHDDKRLLIRHLDLHRDDNNEINEVSLHCYKYGRDDVRTTQVRVPYNSDLPLVPIELGYRMIDDTVVFFYQVQHRSYKKLSTTRSIQHFIPQQAELESLRHRINLDTTRTLLKDPEYMSFDDAYQALSNNEKMAAALHPNYAIVKKSTHQGYLIYHKTSPVIEYDGNEFTSLVSDTHIHKFKLEVGIL